jgi:choline dehydrogenase-like flavoprotein
MHSTSPLSPVERTVLAAVCETFQPSLGAGPTDDAALFGIGASDLGVPAAAESAIALLAPAQRAELRRFLRLLDNPLFGLAMSRTPRGITSMPLDMRADLLNRLAASRIPQLRTAFQALKRLTCFLYYTVADSTGTSPVWPPIRYQPSSTPKAAAASVRTSTTTTPITMDADACVIGSGAGGGVAAAELARRGLKVVLVEAGPGDQASDFDQRELNGTQRLYLDNGLSASRDLGVAILAGACLGGGTTINWQTCLRTPDFVRDEWSALSGCERFSSEQFSRALDFVCARSGVSTDETVVNANNAPLQRGCSALGFSWSPIARNARGCDTTQCGYCTFGCRVGGKQSTTATFLHDAQHHGDTTIVVGCSARRVTLAGSRVTGVVAEVRHQTGVPIEVTIRAPRVIVAAGGIHSPALLMRSGLTMRHLGRNLYLHPTTAVAGLYAESIEAWFGPPQSVVSNHFARIDGNFGFRLEAAPSQPGLLALALPWKSAAHHRRVMQRCADASAMIALTRDSTGGRVRARRDGTVVIDYVPGKAERALIARGAATAARVHLAAGADEVHTLHTAGLAFTRTGSTTEGDIERFCQRVAAATVDRNRSLLFSAHQMGTCRMGSDPASAVCDERGEVFGVAGLYIADASAFPSSSGVNPMISVMALAQCVAEGIS